MTEHKTISLADQVFERLETDILSGKYSPGDILTELKLVGDLGVSRTPIREALPSARHSVAWSRSISLRFPKEEFSLLVSAARIWTIFLPFGCA